MKKVVIVVAVSLLGVQSWADHTWGHDFDCEGTYLPFDGEDDICLAEDCDGDDQCVEYGDYENVTYTNTQLSALATAGEEPPSERIRVTRDENHFYYWNCMQGMSDFVSGSYATVWKSKSRTRKDWSGGPSKTGTEWFVVAWDRTRLKKAQCLFEYWPHDSHWAPETDAAGNAQPQPAAGTESIEFWELETFERVWVPPKRQW